MSSSIKANRKRSHTLGARDPVSCSLRSTFLLLGIWTQSKCAMKTKYNFKLKPSLWKQKRVLSLLTRLGQFIPPATASCSVIYSKNSCLLSAPCSAVYYLGLSACSVGRQAFLIVQSPLRKTHWRIYLLLALSWEWGLLLDEVGTLLVHLPSLSSLAFRHTATVPKVSLWDGPQHFIKSPAPQWAKLCCAMMCVFLFMLILSISQVCVSTNFSLPRSNCDYHITQT